jgi:hypothetical protein
VIPKVELFEAGPHDVFEGQYSDFCARLAASLAVAVDSSFVYWVNFSTGTIGRANVDGTGANQSFITGADIAAIHIRRTRFTS